MKSFSFLDRARNLITQLHADAANKLWSTPPTALITVVNSHRQQLSADATTMRPRQHHPTALLLFLLLFHFFMAALAHPPTLTPPLPHHVAHHASRAARTTSDGSSSNSSSHAPAPTTPKPTIGPIPSPPATMALTKPPLTKPTAYVNMRLNKHLSGTKRQEYVRERAAFYRKEGYEVEVVW
ncbi:hypothetical protein BU16DRAFT_567089 [Lophium mytilinum]|uniref:Uncharacterized protein n=1 Tax=Lophium mytilinum TaxID=390894 RepID=A0A6A6QEB3_9PEZI|nr:hypothetical protein BU16DRAFT_567089 [Lophium mytilinum]